MQIQITEENIPMFEALASPIRIRIIRHLAKQDANIKELAEITGVSSAIMTSHIKKLEQVGIVQSERSGRQGKVCTLLNTNFNLEFPKYSMDFQYSYDIDIPVGQYTLAHVEPTCGIADEYQVIFAFDDPRSFFDPRRMDAQLIWFSKGYVEYTLPNYIPASGEIASIEIVVELASEYPHYREDWPSDIIVSLNGEHLCTWTSPGDFGKRRGNLTPSWWTSNQYGLLKTFRVNNWGTFIDEKQIGDKTLSDFRVNNTIFTLRFSVSEEEGQNTGGLSIFGKKFGNHAQDIHVRIGYNMCGEGKDLQ